MKKKSDPIVDQVRKARDAHAAKFGYDIQAIFKAVRQQQAATGREYVRYSARRLSPPHVADKAER